LVVAVAEVAGEGGLAEVTVSAVTARARVSRKTFYDYFGNREECVEFACEEALAHLFGGIESFTAKQPPAERVGAGIAVLVRAAAAEPKLAELALVHAPALGGERGRGFQRREIETIGTLLSGEEEAPVRGSETIASAILGVLACSVRSGEMGRADEVAGEVERLAGLVAEGLPGR
jgi:AcrR family transcriptional regulator